ncbi:MAG: redoxin domain-containing protein [Flavobacteriaceae bacterium]|nr:redoxin domain-containing protein [Flavobacteriaceae bacterium]
MRKKIKIVLAVFLISVVSYLTYNIVINLKQKKELAERIKNIPNFNFKKLDNTYFTQNNISKTLSKLFIYYNSECDFCKSEATQIYNNLESLKNVQIIFVSHEEQLAIKLFAEANKLNQQDNIVFLEDEKLRFSKIFAARTIPYMLLYNKDNVLIKKFRGATKIEKVLDLLE